MTATMIVSAALGLGGVIGSSLIYAFAPKLDQFSIWDVGLVGGFSTTALGLLGALVEFVTTV